MLLQQYAHGMMFRSVESSRSRGTIFSIHGLGESGLCLERFMTHPALGDFSHMVPDLPGYGKSPWLKSPLGIAGLADAFAEWMKRMGPVPAIVLGHSMGGVIGTVLCERHPEIVSLFVNVEGNISLEDCTFSSHIASCSPVDFVGPGLERFLAGVYEEGLHDRAFRTYYASLSMCDPQAIHANSAELMDLSAREDLARRLAGLGLPACYLWGSPRGAQEHSLNLLRSAGVPLVCIENAGHWPFIDQPDVFARKLQAHIEAVL